MNIINRCEWCGDDPLYTAYHDEEWGVPVHDDQKLFEMLILEGVQAGLSWITVLRKRENYRNTFDEFNAKKIARYDEKKQRALLQNPGIIRNRLKIQSAIQNAKSFLETQKEFGSFDKYIWQFVSGTPIRNKYEKLRGLPAKTKKSDVMSQDLKKRGYNFVGSTICYAYMQSVGMVNDHVVNCFRYTEV